MASSYETVLSELSGAAAPPPPRGGDAERLVGDERTAAHGHRLRAPELLEAVAAALFRQHGVMRGDARKTPPRPVFFTHCWSDPRQLSPIRPNVQTAT